MLICKPAQRAVKFYAGRIAYWHNRMGAASGSGRTGSERASGPRSPWPTKGATCPRYLAHVLQRKAYALHRAFKRALKRQIALERQHPKWIALRLLNWNREDWDCLLSITWVENRTMDPTLDYGGGHGNVYEAYGIPQATPGTKMASAGPDWRTNPETQLRWMIDYCKSRYGSVCGAAYHRRVYGTY